MSPPPRLPGLTLERRVGEGAMGEVWRARDAAGRAVAVKLLRPGAEADRFVREVETLAAVEHEHVVRLLGSGREGERRWVVMELVEGGSLADLLAIGALGPEGLAAVLRGVASGLAALHARGVVHRDVKPGNVLLDAHLSPRLVDFGLASFVEEVGRLTGSQEAVGTPFYMAPEVLGGARPGPPADVWAVGVILLEGLRGAHPLAGVPLPVALRRVRTGELPAPPASTPPWLLAALRAALALDPARRPGARELAAMLASPAAAPAARESSSGSDELPAAQPVELAPLLPGQRVGPYVLERALGSGAAASVFVARHTDGQVQALKVLRRASPEAAARFRREGLLLRRLPAQAGLVRVHAEGTLPDGRPWLAMDLVQGRTLREVLRGGPLPLAEGLELGAGLARALAHVHGRGIAHRDLKPENVLLDGAGAPVLVDFGVALDTAEDRLTRSHVMLGTVGYLAPEQVRADRRRVGPPADVFALGVLLHEALTGRHPFPADTPLQAIMAALERTAPPLRADCPQAPPDLERLLQAMLERHPARRPAAGEVAAALRAIGRGGGWRPRARAPRGLLLAAALVVLGGGLALALRGAGRGDRDPQPAVAPLPSAAAPRPQPLEEALAAAAAGDLETAAALLGSARAADEPAAREGVAAAVSRALGGADREATTRLVDALARAWPEAVPPAGARTLAERAARLDAAGKVEAALDTWGLAMDVDPSCAPPPALGIPLVVILNDLLQAGEVRRVARILLIAIRAGWPPGASLTRHYQTVATRLSAPPPGVCERAPWAWDLLLVIAGEASFRRPGLTPEERLRLAEEGMARVAGWIDDPRVPAHARARAEELTLELLAQAGRAEEVERRVEAVLADPQRAAPPMWKSLYQAARAWAHVGQAARARPWVVRALDLVDGQPAELGPRDADHGDVRACYLLAIELAVATLDGPLGERILAGRHRSCLRERLELAHAVVAHAAGDLEAARAHVQAALQDDPQDELVRRFAARLGR